MKSGSVSTPGPEGVLTNETLTDPLAFLGGLIETYGDSLRYQTRFGPTFLFRHPDQVHTVLHRENYYRTGLVKLVLGGGLLATDGPGWREQRRLVQKEFHAPRIEPFVSIMSSASKQTAAEWADAERADESVDISSSMTRLTLRIVVRSLFSNELSDEREHELCDAITEGLRILSGMSWTVYGVPVMLGAERTEALNTSTACIDRICLDMIQRRRDATDRPRDLLTFMIEAEEHGDPLSDKRLRDEMVTMLIGGHETTAMALTWAFKLLTEHPEFERKLHDEIDRVLGDRPVTVDDLPRLRWTRAIFSESMRLYPPVWIMPRVAQQDDVIDGHAIPKGACVIVAPYFTHRHPDFWPDPERFDPGRFVHNEGRAPHRYAYFPFAGGRHQCLGLHFARVEGVVVLAELARRFGVRSVGGRLVMPDPGITMRQSPHLYAHVEARP